MFGISNRQLSIVLFQNCRQNTQYKRTQHIIFKVYASEKLGRLNSPFIETLYLFRKCDFDTSCLSNQCEYKTYCIQPIDIPHKNKIKLSY
jgi:hypothetical protein